MLCLTGCDLNTWIEEYWPQESEDKQVVKLTLAVAPHIAWMPWFLANEEGTFHDYVATHHVDVQFITDTYQNAIDKFIEGEIQAIAITNIDAIAQLVRGNVEADVILIASYSYGNEAILLPADADPNILKIRGKTFALAQFSSRHYLLDRFLVRNQIPFGEVKVLDTPEADIPDFLLGGKVYGVVTSNPYLDKLTGESRAKVLFDSRQIPNEIVDLIVVHRDTLLDYPAFAQVLLGSWFSVMEKLQGNRKGSTLDAMARLAGVSREDFERQIAAILLNDTPTKALSAIRDRRMRKTMRHVRYFIERHQLANEEPFTNWVSYPGRTQALLHFNGQPLQDFVAPPKVEDF
jgi:NitT/TauT family transport system substrate-binding protein